MAYHVRIAVTTRPRHHDFHIWLDLEYNTLMSEYVRPFLRHSDVFVNGKCIPYKGDTHSVVGQRELTVFQTQEPAQEFSERVTSELKTAGQNLDEFNPLNV